MLLWHVCFIYVYEISRVRIWIVLNLRLRHGLVKLLLLVSIIKILKRFSVFILKVYAQLRILLLIVLLFWECLRLVDVRNVFIWQVVSLWRLLRLSSALFAVVHATLFNKACSLINHWTLTSTRLWEMRTFRTVKYLWSFLNHKFKTIIKTFE